MSRIDHNLFRISKMLKEVDEKKLLKNVSVFLLLNLAFLSRMNNVFETFLSLRNFLDEGEGQDED